MKSRKRPGQTVALALTWDGTRWPVKSLPAKARAFLSGRSPDSKSLAKLFTDDQICELRICWVPRLKGGMDVLSHPFSTSTGKRLPFRFDRMARFGDMLGIVYRR